jgi:hypothetical protein
MDQIEDVLISLASDRTDGYGRRPIPDAVDAEIRGLVRYLSDADPVTRDALLSMMTERHGFVLLAFAERMASLAVRSWNPEFVREGLEALAFGTRLVYFKEAVSILSLLYRSLTKLGVNATAFFAGAVGLGDELFDSLVRAFPSRDEQDRAIEAMGYTEGLDQDGFRYARAW